MTRFKGLRHISPYVAGKQPKEKNMIKLNTNENAYGPSPAVMKAINDFDGDKLRNYSSLNHSQLCESLARQLEVSPEQLVIGNGSDDILSLAFLAFFNSQSPILFPDLTYGFYKVWAELYRIPYQEIPLNSNFDIDFKDYHPNNGGIVIANPNAPTGVYKPLAAIESLLQAHPDVIIILDEAYVNFGGKTAISLLAKYDNLFITRTFSKDASLAGLRVGYGIGSPDLINLMKAIRNSVNPYSVDCLAEHVATAAVEDWPYYERNCQKIMATRQWFQESLEALGFEVLPSSTNFLLVKPLAVSAGDIFQHLERQKIYVRYFPKIDRIKNYLRISIGTQKEMEKVIMAIQELL